MRPMDMCFEATDDALDIAHDYIVVRAKLEAVRKKIDLIRKKIDSHEFEEDVQYAAFNKITGYDKILSGLIDLSEKSLGQIMYFGRTVAYNAAIIDNAMNMEDEQ